MRYLFVLLLCASIVAYIVSLPEKTRLYDLFLPGAPHITADAFLQLSDSLDRGEPLSDALDVFCTTIMDVR